MTDYTDLVNWLRDNAVGVVSFRPKFIEAANAIEEQAARIEELEGEIDIWKSAYQYAERNLKTYEARIAALEAALKLYEDALDEAEAIFGGEYADSYGAMFKLAMEARDARAALEGK